MSTRYSQVLLAVWRQRDRSAPWGRRLVGALLVAVCAGGMAWLPREAGWLLMVGVALLVILGGWLAVCGNLQEQNEPNAARHVPGHQRTLRHAALMGWALCTGLAALLMGVVFPPPVPWQVLLLSCGAIAVFLLWSSRMVWLWLVLTLLSPLAGLWAAPLAPAGRALAAAWAANSHAMLVLALLAQAGLVVAAFGAGDARHRARYTRQTTMRQAMRMQMEGQPAGAAAWGRPLEWLARPYALAFDAWQRRLLARADNTCLHSVMARAAIVLHGPQHWLYQVFAAVTLLAFVGSIFGVVLATTPADPALILRNGAYGMGIAIASMGFNPGFALPTMLWRSRREQALLCLLPGMPRGTALNRAVARLQLRDGLAFGGATSIALLAVSLAAGKTLLMVLPLAALPLITVTLTRRVAAMRAPTAMTPAVPVFLYMALAGALYLLVNELGVPLWLTGVCMLALSAALLAWRWRALCAGPAALPAGRLS